MWRSFVLFFKCKYLLALYHVDIFVIKNLARLHRLGDVVFQEEERTWRKGKQGHPKKSEDLQGASPLGLPKQKRDSNY